MTNARTEPVRATGSEGSRATTSRRAILGQSPILPRSYVPRRRLAAALDSATCDGGLTLLVAPAGAGKTLGVAGWLRDRGPRGEHIWLRSADAITVEDLTYLTGLADEDGAPHLVVIDDAQELSPTSISWLDHALDQSPERLHVLLLSRWDLPLTRLVPELLGHLTVLRGGLLQLDEDETARLVADHARNDSPDLARVISARTRGWCAAVVMAAKAIADRPDPLRAARDFSANVGILDRVAGEAFAALTPSQRHLLLCVAAESHVSAAQAVRLTNDENAGRILEQLESTGLHVTRYHHPLVWVTGHPGGDTTIDNGPASEYGPDVEEHTFLVHPLLRELSRRRLAAGGVDVERARSTVRRAVTRDLSRGELSHVLRRLVTVGDHAAVVRTLASHGPALVLGGHAREVQRFARRHPEVVARSRGCWLPLAVERWESGDVAAAREWLSRLNRASVAGTDDALSMVDELEVSCRRLLRASLGDEPLDDAVATGEATLRRLQLDGETSWPLASLLRLLVGTAHVRLGDPEAAERHLTAVAEAGEGARWSALVERATSQLALAALMRGRDHTVMRLTSPAGNRAAPATPRTAGLTIARHLVALQTVAEVDPLLPAASPVDEAAEVMDAPVQGDPVASAFLQILRSRRLLLEGRAAEAERLLQTAAATTSIPQPLEGAILLEESLQASLTGDRDALRRLAERLTERGLSGEAALAEGLRADLADDLSRAAELFDQAARTAACEQPPAAAVAMAARAQVLDAMGRRAESAEQLLEAVRRCEVRRLHLPFLGLSRHGRPMVALLDDLAHGQASPWCKELAVCVRNRPAMTSLAGLITATPQEQARVADGATYVSLSPRERDVLHELARGSTYADIAANLFLSENTVKTHVSSVYSKLAVNRRSDALAVARTHHLI